MPNILRLYESDADKSRYLICHRDFDTHLLITSSCLQEISAKEASSYRKGNFVNYHGCIGILPVTSSIGDYKVVELLLLISHCESVGKLKDAEIFRIVELDIRVINIPGVSRIDQLPHLRQTASLVKGFYSNGKCYFAVSPKSTGLEVQIEKSQQRQSQGYQESSTDSKYVWNRGMLHRFKQFGISEKWIFKVICGGIAIRSVNVQGEHARLCVIYRQSCERAGTRFLTRGVDENGQVANFVETEIIICVNDCLTSYVLTRGSVPLFWEQPGIQVGAHKTRFTREPIFHFSAFLRHMHNMRTHYGQFTIVDLLGINRGSEAVISDMYLDQLRNSSFSNAVSYIRFDFHAECPAMDQDRRKVGFQKFSNLIQNSVSGGFNSFGFYYNDGGIGGDRHQLGVFRVNCLDCLDRTNMIQTYIGERVLPSMLSALRINPNQASLDKFLLLLPEMMKFCGDEISRLYAGTSALCADDKAGKLFDAGKSAARTLQNNFLDEAKQQTFDLVRNALFSEHPVYQKSRMLCHDVDTNIPFKLREYICDNQLVFTSMQKLRVCIGTWNVNGGKQFQRDNTKDQTDVSLWLFNAPFESLKHVPPVNGFVASDADFKQLPDIYVIGFEEIVDLDLKNIVSTSHTTADQWHDKLCELFCPKGYSSVLRGCQLVGVCLLIFVKNEHVPFVKAISSQSLKTGLKGAAGNKGAVAIRFQLYATSLVFVCAHFAAGQSNVTERNDDFNFLNSKFRLPLAPASQSLNEHDYVFWCGDFNYRIDLENQETRDYIERCQWPKLMEKDQLVIQKGLGNVFTDYQEGVLMFAPTYKYDLLTDDYDSSEKCRTPAWTDRVLWKRRHAFFYLPRQYWPQDLPWHSGDLLYYGRAEVKSSDHRPVVAYIDIDVQHVESESRSQTVSDLMKQMGPPNAAILVKLVDLRQQNWMVLDAEWTDYLKSYLHMEVGGADASDPVAVSRLSSILHCRHVSNDMMIVLFKEGAHALTAASELSGRRLTDSVELRIELSTPNYFDTYYWPELKRVEEKAALDAKIEVEVRERLHKIEKQFMCKTPKSPKELINLNSPGPSTTTQSTTSVAPPRPPPPGRPPPPKISASHSMGDLAKCNRPVITTGVVHSTDHENIVEQTPLLGVDTGVLTERALSSYDVRNAGLNVGTVNPKLGSQDHPGAPPNFLMPMTVGSTEEGGSALSLYESAEDVNATNDSSSHGRTFFPGPPSNCNSFYDLTEPVAGTVAAGLSSLSLQNSQNQQQQSANRPTASFSSTTVETSSTTHGAVSQSNNHGNSTTTSFTDDASNQPPFFMNGGATNNSFVNNSGFTDFNSNNHIVQNKSSNFDDCFTSHVIPVASNSMQPSSLDSVKSNQSASAPPPLPPKSEKHKRPIPFPLPK